MSLGWWFIIFHTTSLATVRICWNISWWVNPTTVTLKKQLTLPEFHIGRISIQISKKGLYYVSSSTITIPLAAFDFWECFLLTVKSSNLWYNRYPMFLVLVLHPSDGKEQPYHCHPNHYRFQQWTDDATPTRFTLLTRRRKKVELQS